MRDFSHRIVDGRLCGVDIVVDTPSEQPMRSQSEKYCLERKTVREIPVDVLLDLDLIIGTVGRSVIEEDILEKLLIEGSKKALFFCQRLDQNGRVLTPHSMAAEAPGLFPALIRGIPVTVRIVPFKDPQTGLVQGNRVRFQFSEPPGMSNPAPAMPFKDLYLLGDLMPVNFLYYGVPAEIIDEVLRQLLQLSTGFVRALRQNRPLPPRLLAVDREIDADANPI